MNGLVDPEKATTVVAGDRDAQLFYHRVGTDQCVSYHIPYAFLGR
jgi:hypothetical protein